MMRLVAALLLLLCAGAARADLCTASMSNLDFGQVSPIAGGDVQVSASGNVSCSWTVLQPLPPYLLLLPNVMVCVNVGIGSNSLQANPRTLGAGANRLDYNLYRDATYSAAAIAGGAGVAGAPTPIKLLGSAPNLITGGTINLPFTLYGKIAAGPGLRAVPTSANGDTVYSSSFAGAASISYTFYNLIVPSCPGASSGSFSFQVQATAVNNCTISASPLQFGSGSTLQTVRRSTASLSVQCVNNNAYQIALNGGSVAGNPAARRMRRAGGTELLSYELSASLDGPIWGTGSGGTALYSGVGNGEVVTVPVYGRVPVQSSPTPGDYADTVTATVYF